ncbi:uncharacterized protein LOC132695654 [Cylas formicarius]|uniref:uncharacterized protein LOC132695654 n=1 Tax=Cylas formicarius TaxID=197179 RepID=UPI0029583344|nr:uncharacterized protein LOC132695654 [Cylas formicarius]
MELERNFEEFSACRTQEKREVNYACRTRKKYQHGEEKIFFECNRSDYKGFASSAKKRSVKTGGRIHIHGTRHSRIVVNISTDGFVTVKFVEKHLGHTDKLRTKTKTIVEKLSEDDVTHFIQETKPHLHVDTIAFKDRRQLLRV